MKPGTANSIMIWLLLLCGLVLLESFYEDDIREWLGLPQKIRQLHLPPTDSDGSGDH